MADGKSTIVIEMETKNIVKKSRITEKCTFLLTCVAMVTLGQGVVTFQWLVPYIYAILTPILVTIRIIMYYRRRWHFFLLDFCYYANTFCMIFLCIPDSAVVFSVVYSLAMGPLISAIPVYRNSLVLHDIDKVTSTYIHILPPILSFVVRWYPEETSKSWFKPFMADMPELSLVWMYLVPFVAFVLHSGLYSLIVNYIYRSSDNKISSYNYLGEKDDSKLFCLFNCAGPRYVVSLLFNLVRQDIVGNVFFQGVSNDVSHDRIRQEWNEISQTVEFTCRCFMFYFWNWMFCLLSLCCSLISYYSFHANCFFLAAFSAMAVWNGGSYYVHVFSTRGFVEELE